MAKKPNPDSQQNPKALKAGAASGPKVATSKKSALSKPIKEKVEAPNPVKPQSVNSESAQSSTGKPPKGSVSSKPDPVFLSKESPKPSVLYYQEQRARIALRAFGFYEERSRIGSDVQDWLRAEQEIMKKP